MLRSFLRSFQHPAGFASLAAMALFIAVLAWWAWIFHAPAPPAPSRPAPPAEIDATAGATLFGAQPDRGQHDAVQLLGILAFDPRHAAAVVSVGGEPAQVVRLNGSVADSTTLSEVRPHSIMIERNGIQSEIMLPAALNPSAFVH